MEKEVLQQKKFNTWRWLLILVSIFFLILLILAGSALAITLRYENKIYPSLKIDALNLGGLTKTQAENIIGGEFKTTFGKGLHFCYNDTRKIIIDEDKTIFQLNLESLINKAYQAGRGDIWYKNFGRILTQAIFKKQIELDYQLNKTKLKNKIQAEFAIAEKPRQDTNVILTIIDAKTKQYSLAFSPSSTGETFNYNEAIDLLEQSLKKFNNPEISLQKIMDQPKVTMADAQALEPKIKELLALDGLTFSFGEKEWVVKWEDFAYWVTLGLDSHENPAVTLNPTMLNGRFEAIAQEINQKAVDARLRMKDNRVVEFQASQNGQELDEDATAKKTLKEIINNKNTRVELVVKVTEPEVTVGGVNDLGLKEIIGAGVSDFSGSPANRRHNIGVGAATLNGVLITPDEEFSLVKTLGPIDRQHGYLPELVIKDNKTVPEDGGGLCQIGTTTFRAALASGLPITARTPHTYRVIYYEPAGTDATIYNPNPDVRFVNNTGYHILIQTKIAGNKLIFEFWGTKDTRQIIFEGNNKTTDLTKLKPKIFNIVQPGPPKEIETEDLKLGEKKKMDTAHAGADTIFYRTVISLDGTEKKETWSSHYVPWRAVYLIGVDPNKPKLDENGNPILPVDPNAPVTPVPATPDSNQTPATQLPTNQPPPQL